jgi:hypothetical protein
VLVIPIIRGLTPYGFIGKYQGLQATGKTVSQVAGELFGILVSSAKTRARALTCLVDTTLKSSEPDDAIDKLRRLEAVQDLPAAYLERLRDGVAFSPVFGKGPALDELNALLVKAGLQKVAPQAGPAPLNDDEVPF